jgi:putative ABC transport system substrate-binding protein
VPVIGVLSGGSSPDPSAVRWRAFHHGLSENGYVEGRNVAIEYRWPEMPALVADLVRRRVTDRARRRSNASCRESGDRDHSDRFAIGSDSVKFGLVASLNRPGGNVTGVSFFTTDG